MIDALANSQNWCHCERSEAISFNVSTQIQHIASSLRSLTAGRAPRNDSSNHFLRDHGYLFKMIFEPVKITSHKAVRLAP
jgi:hypothetical protein